MTHLIFCLGLIICLPALLALPAAPFFTTSTYTANSNSGPDGGLVGQTVQMQTQGTIGLDGKPVGTTIVQTQDLGQNATAPVIQTSTFGRVLVENTTTEANPNPSVDVDSMSVNTIGFNSFDFQLPGLPSFPGMPSFPSILPSMPNFSNLFPNFPKPSLPNFVNSPTASLPSLPRLPTLPTPSLPNLSTVPGLQAPSFPGYPTFATFPSFSNMFDASRQFARSLFNPFNVMNI